MSARKTAIATAKFEAITTKLGFTVKAKAGSFKAYPANGSIKRSVDVTTSKKGQTVQVILVGFESAVGTVAHPKPPASSVTQMIDFSQDEKLVLKAFYSACKALAKMAASSQPKAETKEEPASTPAAAPEVAASSEPVAAVA
jgi:hypothetical protein